MLLEQERSKDDLILPVLIELFDYRGGVGILMPDIHDVTGINMQVLFDSKRGSLGIILFKTRGILSFF